MPPPRPLPARPDPIALVKIRLPPDETVGFQMAPLIDCVFLLIMFFMVAARLITQTERVPIEIPLAEHAAVAKDPSGRLALTVKDDGTIVSGARLLEPAEVTEMVRQRLQDTPGLRIFLRADKRVPHKRVKEVMKACADGGVGDIIFSAYQSDK